MFASTTDERPPMDERSVETDDRLESASVTVHVRVVVVTLLAVMVAGENEQAEMLGAELGDVTVRVAELLSVAAAESVAVMVKFIVAGVVPEETVMPVRRHVVPDVFVRAAVAEPPMDERLTVTVERLELASSTTHSRVVVSAPVASTEAGENAQEVMTGAMLLSVRVRFAVAEPVARDGSVAVTVMVYG